MFSIHHCTLIMIFLMQKSRYQASFNGRGLNLFICSLVKFDAQIVSQYTKVKYGRNMRGQVNTVSQYTKVKHGRNMRCQVYILSYLLTNCSSSDELDDDPLPLLSESDPDCEPSSVAEFALLSLLVVTSDS